MFVDLIMREVEDKGKRGIQWALTTQLYNVDYVDDIRLSYQKLQHMQAKTNNLALIAETTGHSLSKEKTKVMRANNKQQDKIKLSGESKIWKMQKGSPYLGSAIKVTGGA